MKNQHKTTALRNGPMNTTLHYYEQMYE